MTFNAMDKIIESILAFGKKLKMTTVKMRNTDITHTFSLLLFLFTILRTICNIKRRKELDLTIMCIGARCNNFNFEIGDACHAYEL